MRRTRARSTIAFVLTAMLSGVFAGNARAQFKGHYVAGLATWRRFADPVRLDDIVRRGGTVQQ
jgi:hypothetical protein